MFLDKLKTFYTEDNSNSNATIYKAAFNNMNCKRLIFDSEQASVFIQTMKPEYQSEIKTPFDWFYMEFSIPILLPNQFQEPGMNDYLRSIIFRKEKEDIGSLSFFLTTYDGDNHELPGTQIADRAWLIDLDTWQVIKKDKMVNNVRGEETTVDTPSWWNDNCQDNTNFFTWILLYMMAKNLKIQPETLSRQQRRYNERHNIIPNPWHRIIHNPKSYYHSGQHQENESSSTYHKHSFRYDVIGFLRYGRHKLKDGTYRKTIEWVPAHQRGLKNELYIPKTYIINKGKQLSIR